MLYTPSHAELAQHPKTRKLARLLGVGIPTAIGHLHLLWHFALKYAPDGCLARFDCDEIADGCLWEGDGAALTGALIEAGWLEVASDATTTIHDWQEYGGKYINRKEANAQRMREARATNKPDTNAPRATHVQRTSATRVEPEERRGEKRKEEENIHTPKPPTAQPTRPPVAPPLGGVSARRAPKPSTLNPEQQPRFDRWYAAYPNRQHRPEAEKAFAKLNPDDDLTDRLIADMEQRKRGRKWGEGIIEHPSTYLNQRVWEDDIEPVRLGATARAPNGTSNEAAKFSRTIDALQNVGGRHEPAHIPDQHG